MEQDLTVRKNVRMVSGSQCVKDRLLLAGTFIERIGFKCGPHAGIHESIQQDDAEDNPDDLFHAAFKEPGKPILRIELGDPYPVIGDDAQSH